MGGSVNVARWLREHGADFTTAQVDGHTPLHKAALKGKLSMLDFLLIELKLQEKHDVIFAKDNSGATALDIARRLLSREWDKQALNKRFMSSALRIKDAPLQK